MVNLEKLHTMYKMYFISSSPKTFKSSDTTSFGFVAFGMVTAGFGWRFRKIRHDSQLLARVPRRSTGDKVASVFEFSVCLFVCLFVCLSVYLFVLCKFSNFFLQYKAAALQKNVPRMNTDVLASYTQNIAQGQKNDSRINAVYSGCLVVRVGGSCLGLGLIKCCDFHQYNTIQVLL